MHGMDYFKITKMISSTYPRYGWIQIKFPEICFVYSISVNVARKHCVDSYSNCSNISEYLESL